ncbi:galactose-1-phosphate uridylyltransferase [Aquipuribacter sp. MA13-6]|uniref:galactose-1-phosphate uridylyltransferase n=1 Tax=unclassified Aquipuribacter TaxID=2635084 RepID=UPI003EF03AE0
MNRTPMHLSDGRELFFFDDQPGRDRSVADTRALPPTDPAPELRHDPLVDDWVVLAAHRQTRTHLPPTDQCPLCPSTPARATEVPAPAYDVVVFENRFPSLASTAPDPDPTVDGLELFPRRAGTGRCEVVCFTDEHSTSFAQLSPTRVRTVMQAWADRTRELSALPGVQLVAPFENRGEEIGVTLSHPHGQLYAYPFVPERTARMLRAAERYRDRTGRDLHSALLEAELSSGERVVLDSAHWAAYVPAASRWPVEVHVRPHRRVADLADLTDDEQRDFAGLYLDLLGRLDRLFDVPLPYISAWHQAPVHAGRDLLALHLQITSIRRAPTRLKYLAGSEAAYGAFVNDVSPERTAALLREKGE